MSYILFANLFRATWHELVVHPFWQGQLQVDDGTKKSLGTTADDMDKSRTSFNARTPHEMKVGF